METGLTRRGFVGALALTPLLAGCGAPGNARDTLVYGEQRALRPVAEVADAFAGAPYDLRWATFATPSVQFEAFRSGALDVASSNDITILNAAANGTRFKIVAAIEGGLQRAVGLIARPSSSVRRVAEIKGRKVIVSTARGGSGDSMLRNALREAGLGAEDVEISYAPFSDALTAFQAGQIELLVTNDPYLLIAERGGARLLRDGRGLNADLAYIVAPPETLDDPAKRTTLTDALGRLTAATAWGRAHPDAYAKHFAADTGLAPHLAREVIRRGDRQVRNIDEDVIRRAQETADSLVINGFWTSKMTVAPLFDTSVFPSATPRAAT